jgi:acetyl-CoA carboxylase biotin carboxylase subunit
MIHRLFIANRGEIALRIARTARRMGLEVCAAFSSADGGLPHLRLCHRAVELEGDPARVYLDIPKIIDAARELQADAVHPGYGFLAENEDFAAAVQDAGLTFIGPTPDQIVALGDKVQARKAAQAAGVPTLPGQSEPLANAQSALAIAQSIGFPVLFKAAGGGGGRGMRVVEDPAKLTENFQRAQSEAQAAFNDPRIFMEKFIPRARHVEIQILGDGHGQAIWLGERECSVQRRHQKLIEESPAPALPPDVVANMGTLAAKLAASASYRGAGTMEFIVPFGTKDFFFIEMNTRLQVEHPVTELCTGLDLVEEQIAVANGGFSKHLKDKVLDPGPPGGQGLGVHRRGHAIEARIIAEDPEANFRPSCGKMDVVSFPAGPGIRVDAWAEAGLSVSPYYDSLIAKVLAWGEDRAQAIARLELALRETVIHPIRTTAPFLQRVISGTDFRSGQYDTGLLQRVKFDAPAAIAESASALCAAGALMQSSKSELKARNESRGLSAWQRADGEMR